MEKIFELAQSADVLILDLTPDFKIEKADGAFKVFGYEQTDLVGKQFKDFLPAEDGNISALADKKESLFLSKLITKESFSNIFVPIDLKFIDNKKTAFVRSLKRIKELEEIVRKSKDQLFEQEKMASIGQLASGVAHEINNPLGFVSSNISTLSTYIEPIKQILVLAQEIVEASKAKNDLAVADKAQAMGELCEEKDVEFILDDLDALTAESMQGLERIKKIVMDLKLYARKDLDDKAEADINTVVDSAVNIVWNKIKYHCDLKKNLAEVPLVTLNVQQMTQVFVNLVVNAADAIADRGDIILTSYEKDGFVCVDVKDTGSGMPEEVQQRIFEPLFTTKDPGKGTGLGLSITKEIVRKHSGEIQFQSKVGEGTTFTVKIPIGKK